MSLAGAAAYAGYRALAALVALRAARRDAAKLGAQGVPPARRAERLGNATSPRPDGRLIWIHAVSVGEAMSILPLCARLSADAHVLLTTSSATSAEMVARRAPEGILHQFAPLDTAGAVHRFLEHWRPDLFVLTESELWPRQITEAHLRAIPIALVGARLSDRSLRRWRRIAPLARHMLDRIALVLPQDARTAKGLLALGLDPGRVDVIGNLKCASPPLPVDHTELARMRETLGVRPLWVAASTHPGEEEIVSATHEALRRDTPDLLLILAPRHPERGAEIARALQSDGWQVARRGAGEMPTPETDIYLADTLGELGLWFTLSNVAFIGGSFAEMGGHNPFEAVQLGCHAVTGPSVTNFAGLYDDLIASDVALRVERASDLAAAVGARLHAGAAEPATLRKPDMAAVADALRRLAATPPAGADPRVIAPNFKRRLSGVTATIVRLVPLQARDIAIRATGPGLPSHVPHLPLLRLLALPARVPRVWHARRNVEMLGGLALKHLARKRLKLVFTSASQRHHTGLTRWLIARMDAVIATSDRSAAYLQRRATVIRHGIDTETFAPAADRAALRRALDLPPEAILIGCYGRIRPSKGTDLFVEAMAQVLPRHPDAIALVMGRATDRERAFAARLQERARETGLAERIRFLPEVATHAIAGHYAALDLYVAPQRWEGFGLTPLEAMASGVPVVATRVGAFEELVVDGRTGALVAPDDAGALAAAIGGALDDPDRLRVQGAEARAHVARAFTLEAEAGALNAVYRDLLNRR